MGRGTGICRAEGRGAEAVCPSGWAGSERRRQNRIGKADAGQNLRFLCDCECPLWVDCVEKLLLDAGLAS